MKYKNEDPLLSLRICGKSTIFLATGSLSGNNFVG